MTFYSILFREVADQSATIGTHWPAYALDLSLNQLVEKLAAARAEYDLAALFEQPLQNVDAIVYRHQVMRDLENPAAFRCIASFAEQMQRMRQQLAQMRKLYYEQQKQRWFVHSAETYRAAVVRLRNDLDCVDLQSDGLRRFRSYLRDYTASRTFNAMTAELDRTLSALQGVRYSILIKSNGFKVQKYANESDYSSQVAAVFARFQQGDVKDYRVEFREATDMNHIEAKVLEFVAMLYPQVFASLVAFCKDFGEYLDPTLARFDREIQFYAAYLDFIRPLKRAGLSFCYPEVSSDTKQVHATDAFDLVLAAKLVPAQAPVVCNSFYLRDPERIFVVSGPNQGGKTTFARMFGQLHHLASLGLPVPGGDARLYLCDALYTHFEREEKITNLRGKLEDDLVRVHAVLQQATTDSIIIMNEIFTSTTLNDAVFLAGKVMERITEMDCLCVCVTFLDELASLSEKIVSMTSTVDPDDPTVRTYKVVRRTADGRAYAISLAEKYRLTYDPLKARIPSSPAPLREGGTRTPAAREVRVS